MIIGLRLRLCWGAYCIAVYCFIVDLDLRGCFWRAWLLCVDWFGVCAFDLLWLLVSVLFTQFWLMTLACLDGCYFIALFRFAVGLLLGCLFVIEVVASAWCCGFDSFWCGGYCLFYFVVLLDFILVCWLYWSFVVCVFIICILWYLWLLVVWLFTCFGLLYCLLVTLLLIC